MRPDDASPPDDRAAAHSQIREQAEALRGRGLLIDKLQHQLEQLLRLRYGKKGDAVDPGQLLLFAPGVVEAPAPGPTPASDATTPPATSRAGGRKPLPASLPRRRVVHDVAPSTAPAPCVGPIAAGSARRPASSSSTSPPALSSSSTSDPSSPAGPAPRTW